jgi:beta-mannosidase
VHHGSSFVGSAPSAVTTDDAARPHPRRGPLRRPVHDGWSVELLHRHDGGPGIGPVPATVPGCVHTDLLAARLIPDPFLDAHEHDVAWIADADWRFTCRFDLAGTAGHDHVELVFDGLDTLATIRLDDRVVARTANMHRHHRVDVTDLVGPADARRSAARLTVDLASATRHAEALRTTEGEWPSASFGRAYHYVRKMACSWGWDWGPALTTAGIWRPAHLHAWSTARLGDVLVHTDVDQRDQGHLTVDAEVVASRALGVSGPVSVEVTLTDTAGAVLGVGCTEADLHAGRATHATVTLDPGTVRRWWPRSLGEPHRYAATVRLLADDGTELDRWQGSVGFRTIELDTSADELGGRFAFVVNGHEVFARGVNWIPDDVFPSRSTPDRVRERLRQACEANVDLVRVWGGGLYESDAFYEACDELGLLVWQDMAFACAAYPEHLLVDEVRHEVHDNVVRLHHHPSLALWNGNNENLWGHADWGWQDELEGRAWGAGLYFDQIPLVLERLDPDRPYWPGSPYSGPHVAPNADTHGCTHVWDVWNQLDYERYRDHACRFVAEFGWQAPPTWATLERSVSERPIVRHSPAFTNHQKAEHGDRKLSRGVRTHLGAVPDDLDTWWYATQLLQARAARTGIEHFRSLRGHCMGTIWWQLNDCWPVTSWSVIDGDGHRKPSWFALRDAYADHLLTVQPRGHDLVLFAIDDGRAGWWAKGTATRMRLDGTVRCTQPIDLMVPARGVARLALDPCLASPRDASDEVVVVECGGERTWWWFADDSSARLPEPNLTAAVERIDADTAVVELTADVVVRDLVIHPDRLVPGAHIDRQVVSMLPGVAERFVITGLAGAELHTDALLARPITWTARDLRPGG